MSTVQKNAIRKSLALLLVLAMLISPMLFFAPTQYVHANSGEPSLVITGTGLEKDVVLYESDWKDFNNLSMVERFFSSNNTSDFHKIWKVKGFDLFKLLEEGNLKEGEDYSVKFISSDGFSRSWTINELKEFYYYPDFTVASGEKVKPLMGFYRTEVFDQNGVPKTPITWSDKNLSTSDFDRQSPRLYLGQKEGNVSDLNQSNFVREVKRIVVGEERPVEPAPDDDSANSLYKHISYDGAPYNIDSITGATMTIEGPGVQSYRALSLRQIEEENNGQLRGEYVETINGKVVTNTYEGIPVSYLLDHFVTLRKNLGTIVFRDKDRRIIGEFTLEEIRNEAKGMMIAYGVNGVPLVYDKVDAGYLPEKYNDNGCFKLVYHAEGGALARAFSNVAYIYVEETYRPGYEHKVPPYDDPKFTNYIFSLSGSGLGKEVNYTVADIEAMTDLHIEKEYSLSNSEHYWYYNTYKGVPLWDLLLASGLDPDIDENTPVNFIAADYYNFPPLTIGDIKDPNRWGYYEKDALDMGDGEFDGDTVEPLYRGYPVLVAYGFNGYPYVIHPSDEGHNSGLRNGDGPLRVIFGKSSYDHTNGSHQVKLAKRVIIGDPVDHTTHSYGDYQALASSPIDIIVKGEEGNIVREENLTVADIEAMVYGGTARERDTVRVKNYYFTHTHNDNKISDLYEGIGLNELLFNKIGLPGTMGTVTFENDGGESLTLPLEDILKNNYFNEVTRAIDLKPVLAFGKNGYPMVEDRNSQGYIGNPVVNRDGPLRVLFGQTQQGQEGKSLSNVRKIIVNIEKDTWAHLELPYDQYASNTLSISGTGVRKSQAVTVEQLQNMQRYIFTDEYCLVNSNNVKSVDNYRGIDIYEYLRLEVGLTGGADKVTFEAEDGTRRTFNIQDIARRNYINEVSGSSDLKVMLAYGKNQKPLVPDKESEGHDNAIQNNGGPLRLIIGQTAPGDQNSGRSVKNVTKIIVEAAEGDSWKHDVGVYTQYLDKPVLRITGSQVKEPRTFSLRQLQALDPHIIRDVYLGKDEVEGIILWNLIKDVVGLNEGVTTPSSIRIYAGAGYNQLQVTSDVMNGVRNSRGERKEILLSYALNGYPLVPHSHSEGYVHNNEYGPLRLAVEENAAMWTKWVDCIVVGTGNYEAPRAEDIIDLPPGGDDEKPDPTVPELVPPIDLDWSIYQNNNATGLPEASVRTITQDHQGGVWVGTNGGGAAYRDANGQWKVYNTNNSPLPHDTVYDIAIDHDGGVWFVGGSPENGMGVVHKQGENWTFYTSEEAEEVPVDATVFTVSGDGVGPKGYTLAELKQLGETTGTYTYRNRTVETTGTLVGNILRDLNIIQHPEWIIDVATTDNTNHSAYKNITVAEAIDQKYMLAWLEDGEAFEDAEDGFDSSNIRIYRNLNDGSNWQNQLTRVNGINITPTTVQSFVYQTTAATVQSFVYQATTATSTKESVSTGKSESKSPYETLPSGADFAQAIAIDKKGGIWIGTAVGLVYRDPEGQWTYLKDDNYPASSVTQVLLDDKGGAWIGFYPDEKDGNYYGGYAYRDANGNVTSYEESGFSGNWTRSISIDAEGGVWVARFGKVDYIAADGSRKIYENDRQLLPHLEEGNSIRAVAVDSKGGLWIGTTTGGLYYRDAENNYSVYNQENTWPTYSFNSVWVVNVDEDETLWIGTNGGVATASLDKLEDLDPEDPAQTLAEAKTVVKEKLASFTVTNNTTKAALIASIEEIVTNKYIGISIENFNLNAATTESTGSITAYVKLALGTAVETVTIDLAIAKLETPKDPSPGTPPGSGTNPGEEQPIPDNWVLKVEGGGVSKTAYFTMEDLKAATAGRVSANYFSINNWGTEENTSFTGISLAYLLDNMVSLTGSAKSVDIRSSGFYRSYNMSDVRRNYIDQTKPSARLPMILAWQEDGQERYGRYPLRLVMGQTEAGDVNKPNWVRDVSTITVNGYGVTPGSGTPGSGNSGGSGEPQAPALVEEQLQENVLLVNTEKYAVREIVQENGKTIEKLILSDDIIETLKEMENQSLLITAEASSQELQVMITGKTIEAATDKKITLIVQTAEGQYELPIKALPLKEVAQELNVDISHLSMNLKVGKTDTAKEKSMQTAMTAGQEMVASPMEFHISFSGGDRTVTVNSFGDVYVKREIKLNQEVVNGSQIAGVYWNEEQNRFSHVPTQLISRDGNQYASLRSRYNSSYTVLKTQKTFRDTHGHWAEPFITTMASKLLLSGRDQQTFDPEGIITRAEMAILLAKGLDLRKANPTALNFTDVVTEDWFATGIAAVNEAGLASGYPDGSYRPYQSISRQEFTVFTGKVIEIILAADEVKTEESIETALDRFTDGHEISQWAQKHVAQAVKAGIISGYPEGDFRPHEPVTRAQAAVMIQRLLQYIKFID